MARHQVNAGLNQLASFGAGSMVHDETVGTYHHQGALCRQRQEVMVQILDECAIARRALTAWPDVEEVAAGFFPGADLIRGEQRQRVNAESDQGEVVPERIVTQVDLLLGVANPGLGKEPSTHQFVATAMGGEKPILED